MSSTYWPRPATSLGSSLRLSGRPTYGPRSVSLIGSRGHRVAQLADAFDPELHDVAGLEEHAPRHPHAGRRAGQDEVARLQGHARRQHRDLLGGVLDHAARAGVLHERVVDPELKRQRLRIGKLVDRNDPGPERARDVEALLAEPVVVER